MIAFDGVEGTYGTILVDPPWTFRNRTGKIAPGHRRLHRYHTLSLAAIRNLPVAGLAMPRSHLWLWTPNAMLREALTVIDEWGFTYKTNFVWYKVTADGRPDRRGCGFYARNVTELLLLGIKGNLRTLPPGRSTPNIILSRKRDHSRKPAEAYPVIESLSPGPRVELFARGPAQPGWVAWGDQVEAS